MPLVLVTGSSGVGKSTVCAMLRGWGHVSVDADWEGYSHWADRGTGSIVVDPPYPVPAGWLDRFAWKMSRQRIAALAETAGQELALLFGSAENEGEVRDLFDLGRCRYRQRSASS